MLATSRTFVAAGETLPPSSAGEVAPSYGDGGVTSHNTAAAHDPSAPDYGGISPSRTPRRGGKSDRSSTAQLSFEQSRGVIFFSAAYLPATSLTSGTRSASSPVYQSEITFHSLPSHWWT